MSDRATSHTWLVAAAIALLAALPYVNALRGEFVFDDVHVISENPVVQRDPVWGVFTYVLQPGAYRPLTMLTYVANERVSAAPWGFHLVNVALHVLVALAAYALALRLLTSPLAAGVAAALFAVHPIHTEAVTSIVGRAELLAALGSFATLLAFARGQETAGRRRTAWNAASLAAFALALLAKESAMTAIGLVAVLHWCMRPHAGMTARLRALLPYAAIGIASLGLRLVVVGSFGMPEPPAPLDNVLAYVDTPTRLRTAVMVLWDYLSLLAVPIRLSADYSFNAVPPVSSTADPRLLAAIVLLGAAAAVAAVCARHARPLFVGALFLAVPLALTANLLVPIGTIKAERLLYLPSFGWCMALGWLTAWAAHRYPRATWTAMGVVLALFAARTWTRNADWANERRLYEATVASEPGSAKAHHNLAVALQRAGDLDESMVHYRRALEIFPDYASAAFGIGHIYSLKGIQNGAEHWYQEALRLDWHFTKAHLQLGMLRADRGDYTGAEAAFTAGLEHEPDNPLLLVNLAAVRLSQGNRWGAEDALRRLNGVETADSGVGALVAAAQREIEVALR